MSHYVNPKLYLDVAKIPAMGKGVFAKEKINKDELICHAEGRILTLKEAEPLSDFESNHCFDIDSGHVLCPKDFSNLELDWHLNHSCEPNVGVGKDPVEVVAMRDIEPGEELTLDYAMFEEDNDPNWRMPCLCGALNCRKFVTGDDWKGPELQERYKGYFAKHIQDKIDALKQD